MKDFQDIHNLIADDMQEIDSLILKKLSSDVVLINQIANYIISAKGKRLRPMLLILVTKALNYKGNFNHTLAIVIELIHTATLLHDDVVDKSKLRRSRKTANELWGNAAAVLVGDFLYSRSFEMMVEPKSMKIMEIMAKATNTIAKGEVMQLLNIQNYEINEKEYLKVIRRKTACLFQAAARVGAVLTKVDAETENNFKKYGLYLGCAFQIIDDILDYKADSQNLGKQLGDDLAEGKATLPIIYALQKANKTEKEILKNAIKNSDNNDFAKIVNILEDLKAFDYTFKIAENFANKAKLCLNNVPNSNYKQALIKLTDLSLQRKK